MDKIFRNEHGQFDVADVNPYDDYNIGSSKSSEDLVLQLLGSDYTGVYSTSYQKRKFDSLSTSSFSLFVPNELAQDNTLTNLAKTDNYSTKLSSYYWKTLRDTYPSTHTVMYNPTSNVCYGSEMKPKLVLAHLVEKVKLVGIDQIHDTVAVAVESKGSSSSNMVKKDLSLDSDLYASMGNFEVIDIGGGGITLASNILRWSAVRFVMNYVSDVIWKVSELDSQNSRVGGLDKFLSIEFSIKKVMRENKIDKNKYIIKLEHKKNIHGKSGRIFTTNDVFHDYDVYGKRWRKAVKEWRNDGTYDDGNVTEDLDSIGYLR